MVLHWTKEDRRPRPDFPRAARATFSGALAFGHGIHYCAGAPLARLEGQIAIGRLLSRFPALTLRSEAGEPGELHWRGSLLMHGLSSLPVRLA